MYIGDTEVKSVKKYPSVGQLAARPLSGSFRRLETPWTIRERNQEPSLIQPVAWPLHELQFAITSKSALQNTTPYPVILRYQRWKLQGHSKRIFQSVGYFKDLQTTRKDVCSWHWGAAVKCCSLKLVRSTFIPPRIRVQPTSTSGSRICRLYQIEG